MDSISSNTLNRIPRTGYYRKVRSCVKAMKWIGVEMLGVTLLIGDWQSIA